VPFDIVIPTIGRPSLKELLHSLGQSRGPLPGRIFLVDDRREASTPLDVTGVDKRILERVVLIKGNARGPAAARNAGWRASDAPVIAFLDDDVRVDADWLERAAADVAALSASDAGSQGRVRVPLPKDRAPTDWERNVSGLQTSAWITADMIYRRSVLEELGGFDVRFRRAYREDSDFALRVFVAGWNIVQGSRSIEHPVRPADPWVSVRLQAGNADDVLMYALHGRNWRERARAPQGRWPLHLATVACFAAWAALTADFAWRRLSPGPRTPKEIGTVLATSPIIPFAAVYHRVRGLLAMPAALRRSPQ
jgi:glycosyltransferase involved in cell wall biosynthesis